MTKSAKGYYVLSEGKFKSAFRLLKSTGKLDRAVWMDIFSKWIRRERPSHAPHIKWDKVYDHHRAGKTPRQAATDYLNDLEESIVREEITMKDVKKGAKKVGKAVVHVATKPFRDIMDTQDKLNRHVFPILIARQAAKDREHHRERQRIFTYTGKGGSFDGGGASHQWEQQDPTNPHGTLRNQEKKLEKIRKKNKKKIWALMAGGAAGMAGAAYLDHTYNFSEERKLSNVRKKIRKALIKAGMGVQKAGEIAEIGLKAIGEGRSFKQLVKVTLRRMDPTIKAEIHRKAKDQVKYTNAYRGYYRDKLTKGEVNRGEFDQVKKEITKRINYAQRLERLSRGKKPFVKEDMNAGDVNTKKKNKEKDDIEKKSPESKSEKKPYKTIVYKKGDEKYQGNPTVDDPETDARRDDSDSAAAETSPDQLPKQAQRHFSDKGLDGDNSEPMKQGPSDKPEDGKGKARTVKDFEVRNGSEYEELPPEHEIEKDEDGEPVLPEEDPEERESGEEEENVEPKVKSKLSAKAQKVKDIYIKSRKGEKKVEKEDGEEYLEGEEEDQDQLPSGKAGKFSDREDEEEVDGEEEQDGNFETGYDFDGEREVDPESGLELDANGNPIPAEDPNSTEDEPTGETEPVSFRPTMDSITTQSNGT
jgi:hypothetical protein